MITWTNYYLVCIQDFIKTTCKLCFETLQLPSLVKKLQELHTKFNPNCYMAMLRRVEAKCAV